MTEMEMKFREDELAHYGVKGMKWHKHLKASKDVNKNSSTKPANVSQEYWDELNYNSRSNEWTSSRPSSSSTSSTPTSASREYWQELAYNSRSNEYTSNNSSGSSTSFRAARELVHKVASKQGSRKTKNLNKATVKRGQSIFQKARTRMGRLKVNQILRLK